MIEAVVLQRWSPFFAAEVGAAAALSGLIIVAISINVSRILAHPSLPPRAAETLVGPAGVLIACSYALVPDQPAVLLGWEWIVTGFVTWLLPMIFQARAWLKTEDNSTARVLTRAILSQASGLPVIVAGIMVLLGASGAVYWIVPAVIAALIGAILNTWVLLIEILR
jgi:hypothetical protein